MATVGKKIIDISGEHFGKLTVLSRDRNRKKKVFWNVQCECGSGIFGVDSYKLRKGFTTQCPKCSILGSRKDLTGQKFGKWTVLSVVDDGPDKKRTYWKTQCSCGSDPVVLRSDHFINKGSAKDCGCGYIKGKQDIVGEKFNKLTVSKWLEHTLYECECECGNIVVRRRTSLLSDVKNACDDCNVKSTAQRSSIDIAGQIF